MTLEFTAHTHEAQFHSPLEEFELVESPIEHRVDPLTGQESRIVEQVFPAPEEEPDIEEYVTRGEDEPCFFCPDMVEDATPMYPPFVEADRGSVGEATGFPNLFPYAEHSNVVALTEDHFRRMEEFEPAHFRDGFACALEFLHDVMAHDEPDYASINMNLLPSAGSSVVHPHMQTMADSHGTNEMRRIRECEQDFLAEHGESYWDALLAEERDGPRHVGTTGDVEWIAPFAPTHHWHVSAVTELTSLPDPHDSVLDDLAEGITNVLAYYAEQGLNAHNFALRLGDGEGSPMVLDIIGRTPFGEHYVSDAFFFTTIHGERVVDVAPETYAKELAEFF